MSFTAQDVKALREKTGCGMMDCKKALTETNGDMDKAVEDINRAIAVRCVELQKRAEEKAIKLREFREKVMAGTADVPKESNMF